mgnify:CR=1 FL=1
MSESPYKSGTTHFGFRDVDAKDKQKLVGQVFTSVARNYDLMNDLMSFGVHRVWKRYFVATSGVKRGDRVLDLAGGTGDMARRYAKMARAAQERRGGDDASVIVLDYNAEMIEQIARYPRVRDRALFVGDADDVVPDRFGIRLEDHFHMTESGPRWFTEPQVAIDAPFG